jgi:Zn-dependent protease
MRSIRLEFHKSFLLPFGALLAITIFRFGVARGLLSTTLFFACLMAHEAGHAAFAIATQTKVSAVGFSKWGVYIRRHKSQQSANELLIAAAGPLMNLVIALALRDQSGITQWLAQLNGVLFVVNILPFWNSDGKRIMNTLHELRKQSAAETSQVAPHA